jgi:hypothetical protein
VNRLHAELYTSPKSSFYACALEEASVHRQISEYPLDYTKTELPPLKAASGSDSLADRLEIETTKTDAAVDKVAEQVNELTDKAQDAFARLLPSIEKSLKEQPLATLAFASVAAFALGAVLKK